MSTVQRVFESAEELRSRIQVRAMRDGDFRQQIIDNPKEVIEREFGVHIPEEMNILVFEDNFDTIHLALPPSYDLTEEQLEHFGGGRYCACL